MWGGDRRPRGVVTGGESGAVAAAQHPFVDDFGALGLRVELVQSGEHTAAQALVRPGHRVGMQLDDRAPGAPGPCRRFPFVAFEHADIVQRRAAARPEERRPVGPYRPVEPQPLHDERRCGAERTDPGPPVGVTEVG